MTKINVTQTHIDKGYRADASHCAVAKALEAIVKNEYAISVTNQYIRITNGNRYELSTPLKVAKFISKYDIKKSLCEPFSFNLKLPKEILK